MILYLGTSSLVQLYFSEKQSNLIRQWVSFSEAVATCRVAYPEIADALSYRQKEGHLKSADLRSVMDALNSDWKHYVVTDFDEIAAGELVRTYGLRKLDALHLSAALILRSVVGDAHVVFSSADAALTKAARQEGFMVLEL